MVALDIDFFPQVQVILSELFLIQENPEAGGQDCQSLILKLKDEINNLQETVNKLPRIDTTTSDLSREQLELRQRVAGLK